MTRANHGPPPVERVFDAPHPDLERDRMWWEPCGKYRYWGKRRAMDELIHVRLIRRPEEPTERAVHWCKWCRGWHLTRLIQREINNNAPDLRKEIMAKRPKGA